MVMQLLHDPQLGASHAALLFYPKRMALRRAHDNSQFFQNVETRIQHDMGACHLLGLQCTPPSHYYCPFAKLNIPIYICAHIVLCNIISANTLLYSMLLVLLSPETVLFPILVFAKKQIHLPLAAPAQNPP